MRRSTVLFLLLVMNGCTCGTPGHTNKPGAPSASRSTITAESPIDADGVAVSHVTVTVLDSTGLAVPDVTVVLSSSRKDDAFTQPSGPAGKDGKATGTVSSTLAGVATITATVTPSGGSAVTLSQTASVEFLTPCTGGQTRCNGSCVSTQTDPDHCGDCQTACAGGTHASPACTGGVCGITCDAGFADCNNDPTDGCEADLTKPATCGSCQNACPDENHATGTCADPATGACGVSCSPGFGNCNGDPTDGCEADLTTAANCGVCGNLCADQANSTGVCADPATQTCGITCAAGFADCDNDITTGCEASLADPATCGSCQNACAAGLNASAACVDSTAGTCSITCNAGWSDCDTDPTTCETNVQTDPLHCGSCANACPTVPNAATGCFTGQCTYACSSGFADCNGDLGTPTSDGCETDITQPTCACSATGTTSACLTAGTGATAFVYAQLHDNGGNPVTGATVTMSSTDVAWLSPVTESTAQPGTYYREAQVLPAVGTAVVTVSATGAACGGTSTLPPVTIDVVDPVNAPNGGTGGCGPMDGNLRVRVVAGEDGSPIAGAFVMVGPSEDPTAFHSSFEDVLAAAPGNLTNVATTDAQGYAVFSDAGTALDGAPTVTAGATGRAYESLVGIGTSDVVLSLPLTSPAAPEVTLTGTSTGTGYPTDFNGKIEAAMLMPTIDMKFVASFSLSRLLENDRAVTLSNAGLCAATGQSFQIPGNIEVPTEKEAGCQIDGGSPWTLTPLQGSPLDIVSLEVTGDVTTLLAGGTAIDLMSAMTPQSVGILQNVATTASASGLVVDMPSATPPTLAVSITGAPMGTLYALTVGDLSGGNGTGKLFLEGFSIKPQTTSLSTDLSTADPTGNLAGKSDIAVAIAQGSGGLSMVADRTILDRSTLRTLSGFYAYPTGNVSGGRFTWFDVTNGGPPMDLTHSVLMRTTPSGTYGETYEPFWIVYTAPDARVNAGPLGFELPTLPATAPRAADGGYLVPTGNQFDEWDLGIWSMGLTTSFDPAHHAFADDTTWLDRLASERMYIY